MTSAESSGTRKSLATKFDRWFLNNNCRDNNQTIHIYKCKIVEIEATFGGSVTYTHTHTHLRNVFMKQHGTMRPTHVLAKILFEFNIYALLQKRQSNLHTSRWPMQNRHSKCRKNGKRAGPEEIEWTWSHTIPTMAEKKCTFSLSHCHHHH